MLQQIYLVAGIRKKMKKYIEHKGIIIAKVSPTQYAVKIEQLSACATCQAASLCTAAESKEKIIEASSNEDLPIGSSVTVYGKTILGYKALAWAVIIPFVLVFTTLSIVTHLTANELIGGIMSLAILIPYYGILALMRKKLQRTFVFYIKH